MGTQRRVSADTGEKYRETIGFDVVEADDDLHIPNGGETEIICRWPKDGRRQWDLCIKMLQGKREERWKKAC